MAQAAELFDDQPWHSREGTELAQGVEATVEALDTQLAKRMERWRVCVSLYEGVDIADLTPSGYDEAAPNPDQLAWNVHRAACDFVQSEVAGRQKPKPQFMTSGADWRTRRRAKRLDKFVEAVIRQPQGAYANGWEVMEDAWLDALQVGMGFVKVLANDNGIGLERTPLWEIRVDSEEAACGAPRSWFHVYEMAKAKAFATFCGDAGDDDLEAAATRDRKRYAIQSADSGRTAKALVRRNMIRVIEAWYCADENGEGGKHVIVINGECMVEEEWTDQEPPFVVMRWARERYSWYGKGLIEEARSMAQEINEQAAKFQLRFKLCGSKRTYYYEGTVKDEDLEANEHENLIPVQLGQPFPREDIPSPIAPSEVEYARELWTKYWELLGLNQFRQSGQKEPGITAGVAIRAMNDRQSTRLAVRGRQYETAYVSLGKQIVRRAREVATDHNFKLPYPGKYRGQREILDWHDADIGDDVTGDVQVAPASSLPNDPPGRLQMVQELFQAGVVSPDTFKRLLDWPDLDDEMAAESAEREYLEWLIDRYLDAEDGQKIEWIGPEGYIVDKAGAMLLFAREYFQARREGAPDFNLSLLRAYMRQLDALIAPQVPPAGAGAPPGGGGIPAAPPPPVPGGPLPPAAVPSLPVAA